jgi:hypothetical protein
MFEKYMSLPTEIEAVQFTHENKNSVFNSLTGRYDAAFVDEEPVLKIETIHGEIAIVRIGDWIIKDEKIGTYYPIKDFIFKNKYRKVI